SQICRRGHHHPSGSAGRPGDVGGSKIKKSFTQRRKEERKELLFAFTSFFCVSARNFFNLVDECPFSMKKTGIAFQSCTPRTEDYALCRSCGRDKSSSAGRSPSL